MRLDLAEKAYPLRHTLMTFRSFELRSNSGVCLFTAMASQGQSCQAVQLLRVVEPSALLEVFYERDDLMKRPFRR